MDTTPHAGERGGAVGVEMALIWIAMLGLVAAATQVALVFYAGQLALTAAQDALNVGKIRVERRDRHPSTSGCIIPRFPVANGTSAELDALPLWYSITSPPATFEQANDSIVARFTDGLRSKFRFRISRA